MKVIIEKREYETFFRFLSAYIADAEKLNKIVRLTTSKTPGWKTYFNKSGAYVVEVNTGFVIGTLRALHNSIHPFFGDIKAAARLLSYATDGIAKNLKSGFEKLNKNYAIKYEYVLYRVDDPEFAGESIIFGMRVPTNTHGFDASEIYHRHCGERGRWDNEKSLLAMRDADVIATFNSAEDLRNFAENYELGGK